MNLKLKIIAQTGLAARQEGWTEKQLVAHMKKRQATQEEIDAALAEYRK